MSQNTRVTAKTKKWHNWEAWAPRIAFVWLNICKIWGSLWCLPHDLSKTSSDKGLFQEKLQNTWTLDMGAAHCTCSQGNDTAASPPSLFLGICSGRGLFLVGITGSGSLTNVTSCACFLCTHKCMLVGNFSMPVMVGGCSHTAPWLHWHACSFCKGVWTLQLGSRLPFLQIVFLTFSEHQNIIGSFRTGQRF